MRPLGRPGWPLLLLLLAQCRPAVEPRPARETGAFAFLADGDTTVVDEYVRTSDRLSGTVRLLSREPGGAAAFADYRIDYSPTGKVEAADLTIRQVGTAGIVSSATREWNVSFGGDGQAVEVDTGSGRQISTTTAADVAPLFGPSVAMLEAILLQARATSRTRIPIYHLAASGRVDTASIRWPAPDSAEISFAGASLSYRLDETGRILHGASEAEDLRTVTLR